VHVPGAAQRDLFLTGTVQHTQAIIAGREATEISSATGLSWFLRTAEGIWHDRSGAGPRDRAAAPGVRGGHAGDPGRKLARSWTSNAGRRSEFTSNPSAPFRRRWGGGATTAAGGNEPNHSRPRAHSPGRFRLGRLGVLSAGGRGGGGDWSGMRRPAGITRCSEGGLPTNATTPVRGTTPVTQPTVIPRVPPECAGRGGGGTAAAMLDDGATAPGKVRGKGLVQEGRPIAAEDRRSTSR